MPWVDIKTGKIRKTFLTHQGLKKKKNTYTHTHTYIYIHINNNKKNS